MPRKGHVKHQVSVGDRFGRLVVVAEAEQTSRTSKFFICRCDCGVQKHVRKDYLYTGGAVSCGCYHREAASKRARTHGMAGVNRPVEYDAWAHMLRRCYTPQTPGYHHYGGRGIAVCDRWRNSFENFLEDMGHRPAKGYSLDRIDVNGNYEKTNCRWATAKTQCNNKRDNVYIEFQGERLTEAQWRRRLGFPRGVIIYRIKHGWSAEDALTTPPGTTLVQTKSCTRCGKEFTKRHDAKYCHSCASTRPSAKPMRFAADAVITSRWKRRYARSFRDVLQGRISVRADRAIM